MNVKEREKKEEALKRACVATFQSPVCLPVTVVSTNTTVSGTE